MFGVLGHAAIDIIRRGSISKKSPGGAPTYCSFYLKQIGIDLIPITLVGRDFNEYIIDYKIRNIPIERICVLDSCNSTSYEITYYDDTRRLRLLSKCRDFSIDDLHDLPDVVVVNPIAREISLDLLQYIRSQVGFVGVDLQGFSRVFDKNNYVNSMINVDDIVRIIESADLVKVSIDDAPMNVFDNIVNKYPSKVIVLTMGAHGSVLLRNNHKFRILTNGIVNVKDPTGAGDVLTCTLTYMLSRGEDLEWSFIFSNAVAVAKTMGEGPYGLISSEIVRKIASELSMRLIRT
ncbi:MAG: PfkB family carbohydrate kinase [Vulcanisaeta sp.]|jgi:sugar/nucleoside kinase (ribokinase family)|uniref:PfkB domain protein n=1 Tax=Vulcanisaeta moutnovskia (strain 768-28) TaxID=985053 RepID=F0QSY2_VULM7|nr:PfkB family carbohydrate kinase [Vulcanisaeta moutnovskia]ADY00403.1 PfkB domain protein [Vulcanisaeta moutnovskia 768-28]